MPLEREFSFFSNNISVTYKKKKKQPLKFWEQSIGPSSSTIQLQESDKFHLFFALEYNQVHG